MGGSAFASGDNPFYTPRMPPHVYKAVRDRCRRILLDLYTCVASPIEGPAKADYGDIDILLALPKAGGTGSDEQSINTIAKALGAERVIMAVGNGCAANLAIPWPRELAGQHGDHLERTMIHDTQVLPGKEEGKEKELETDTKPTKQRHIQVDVRVSPSLDQFHWTMFTQSHGDLSNILGTMIRPHGLTINESALWLRIPEIEEHDKKRSRVFLSHDPEEVLSVLGLPAGDGRWDRPFESTRDMFEYAAQCRFMHIPPSEGKQSLSQKLKSNDRRRMLYRPVFRKWIEEFVPRCREEGRFAEQTSTRDEIKQEAFARFPIQDEYERRLDAFLLEKEKDYIWNHTIKDNVPVREAPSPADILYRSCLVKALKRIVLEDDTSYGVLPRESLRDSSGRFHMDRVLDFILSRQDEIGFAAMERHRSRTRERLRAKGRGPMASH